MEQCNRLLLDRKSVKKNRIFSVTLLILQSWNTNNVELEKFCVFEQIPTILGGGRGMESFCHRLSKEFDKS